MDVLNIITEYTEWYNQKETQDAKNHGREPKLDILFPKKVEKESQNGVKSNVRINLNHPKTSVILKNPQMDYYAIITYKFI